MNPCNEFRLIGRLTADPTVHANRDGSKKVMFTLAVKNNFKSRNGRYMSQYIGVETLIDAASVAKNNIGPYANIHRGDQIVVSGSIVNNNYVDSAGNKRYSLVLQIEKMTQLESKKITDARLASRAVTAAAEADSAADAAADDDGEYNASDDEMPEMADMDETAID